MFCLYQVGGSPDDQEQYKFVVEHQSEGHSDCFEDVLPFCLYLVLVDWQQGQ